MMGNMEDQQKIKCPNCGYERTVRDDSFSSTEECPSCGIFYKKFVDKKPTINLGGYRDTPNNVVEMTTQDPKPTGENEPTTSSSSPKDTALKWAEWAAGLSFVIWISAVMKGTASLLDKMLLGVIFGGLLAALLGGVTYTIVFLVVKAGLRKRVGASTASNIEKAKNIKELIETVTLKKIKTFIIYPIAGILLILSLYWVYWHSRYEMINYGSGTVMYDKWRNEYHIPKVAEYRPYLPSFFDPPAPEKKPAEPPIAAAPPPAPAPAPFPAPGAAPAPLAAVSTLRFIANADGTVLDRGTGLMWAARDNGSDINWANAKTYCENYRGGGYTDWRMPMQDELAELHASRVYKDKIKLTSWMWASETRDSDAAIFSLNYGILRISQSHEGGRALPIRAGK